MNAVTPHHSHPAPFGARRQTGGVLSGLLSILAGLVLIGGILVAVDILVLESRYTGPLLGKQANSLFADDDQRAGGISAARAVEIGREEARAVAERTARQRAEIAAQDEIARRTGEPTQAATLDDGPDVAQLISQLSGSRQIAAREARRVAEETAAAVAREQALAEMDRYIDSLTAYGAAADAEQPAETDDAQSEGESSESPTDNVETASTAPSAPTAARSTQTASAEDSEPREATEPAARQTTASPRTATPEPATKPTPRAVARAEREPQVRRSGPPSALSLKPWWPDPQTVPDGRLALRYAGEASAADHGIALLFSQAIADPAQAGTHITVRNANGRTVDVDWSAANNPALIRTGALPTGRYVVIIADSMAGTRGATLGQRLEGAVYITQ